MNSNEAIAQQTAVDADVWARLKNDPVDPHGFFHSCSHHDGTEHEGHYFLTYCVVCPEDTGNGKISEEALARLNAERDARWIAEGDVPF